MQKEHEALLGKNIWSLIEPLIGSNVIDCKWVFKLKTNVNGTIGLHKARLVAKGFHQAEEVDFFRLFLQ